MTEDHRNRRFSIQRAATLVACVLALGVLTAPGAAHAQDAFSCIEELSDDQVRYRIRYIEGKLQDGKKHATRWRYTWMSLWLAGGGAMTYAAVNAAQDKRFADRFGWAYRAAGSYFLGLTHAIIPAPGVWGAKRIRRMDDSSEAARRAQLLYATNTLKKASTVQSFMGGAFPVTGSLIYGVVGGTIKATQWPGDSKGLTAAIFVAPVVLTGIQTATAPREGIEAYEAYRGIACSSKYYQREQEGADFDLSVTPGGGGFRVTF